MLINQQTFPATKIYYQINLSNQFIVMGGCIINQQRPQSLRSIPHTIKKERTFDVNQLDLPVTLSEISNKQHMRLSETLVNDLENKKFGQAEQIEPDLLDLNMDSGKIVTLKDLLQDNIRQTSQQQWVATHNTRSRSQIVKRPKNTAKKQQQTEIQFQHSPQSLLQNMKQSQDISAQATESSLFTKISIGADNLNYIQFVLSKCGAGPLVVPYINYDSYQC